MMNAPLSVTVDGQPVKSENNLRSDWSTQNLMETLFLSKLAPGTHRVKLEVLSALVAKDDLVGLPRNAPPADWPPAKKRWTRAAEVELTVYPRDAMVISQTQEPSLDPVRNGSLSVKSVIIHSKGAQAQAVLAFNLPEKDSVPMSFDVAVRLGGQTIPCGNMWSMKTVHGGSYSGEELTVDIARPAAEIKTADIILTPNPNPIEHMASVERIWGGQIVFSNVPLKRLDLNGAPSPELSFGPVVERVLNLNDNGITDCLDLDSGKVVSLRELKMDSDYPQVYLPTTGIAIVPPKAKKPITVISKNTVAGHCPEENKNKEWTDESPQESVDSQAAATLDFINGVSDNAPGSEGLPNTFRFKTRTGHVGLLQITGFTEHPRGVKLRYKLVQNGGTIKKTNSAVSQTKRTYSSFDQPAAAADEETLPSGSINFQNVPLEQVLKVYEALSGRTVIRGTLPIISITLQSATPLTRIQTLQLFDSVLAENGIAMVLAGDHAVKAVPVATAASENPPEITLPWASLPDSSSPMTRTVTVKNLQAVEVVPMLMPFSKLPNSMVVIQDRNLLILRDYSSSIKQELKLLETLEQNPPHAPVPAAVAAVENALAAQPPVVVETFPVSGVRDVPPGEVEIRVRFSKPMTDGSWSWSTAWESSAPEFIGPPHYEADGRTCVVKVKLAPGQTYAFWLNSEKFLNFRDAENRPAIPYLLIFQTKQK
jgi:hypothetical protein